MGSLGPLKRTKVSGKGDYLQIGLARSDFNQSVVDTLRKTFFAGLKASGRNVMVNEIRVPGALELPYALRGMAGMLVNDTRHDVLVALGCVLKGETLHFEIVSEQSARGVMDAGNAAKLPVINGIFTCYTMEQAMERAKNNDLAAAAITMADLCRFLPVERD